MSVSFRHLCRARLVPLILLPLLSVPHTEAVNGLMGRAVIPTPRGGDSKTLTWGEGPLALSWEAQFQAAFQEGSEVWGARSGESWECGPGNGVARWTRCWVPVCLLGFLEAAALLKELPS